MNPYEPILEELATGMLQFAEVKPNFNNNALLDATLIFQTVLFDKVLDLQLAEKMTLKDSENMAESLGNELRKIIHTYTGLDTHELVNHYNK